MNVDKVEVLVPYLLKLLKIYVQQTFSNSVNYWLIYVDYLGLRRTHFPGSATASICVLNNRDMTALNLGDSGFILIRFDTINNDPFVLIRSKE